MMSLLYRLISKHVLRRLLLTVHFVSRELHSQMVDPSSNTYKCNYTDCIITRLLIQGITISLNNLKLIKSMLIESDDLFVYFGDKNRN